MPSTDCPSDLPDIFADFFLNKIEKIREEFPDQHTHNSYHRNCAAFTGFVPLERDEILSIIKKYESNNLHHGSLHYQISTKIQRNNLRCHHHHS